MEKSFLAEFKKRDYFNQCTNSEELEALMNKKKLEHIGFDCTASSLHVGSLLQIMCLSCCKNMGTNLLFCLVVQLALEIHREKKKHEKYFLKNK